MPRVPHSSSFEPATLSQAWTKRSLEFLRGDDPSVRSARQRLSIAALLALLLVAGAAEAQEWGTEPEDDWSSESSSGYEDSGYGSGANYSATDPAASPWSLRMGLGFIHDPDDFLLNFEIPYAFDQYVSAGPMVQVGIEDNRLVVAPTANLTITVPNLPGEALDRFHPNLFAGVGFAVIENDDRAGDNSSVGFLVNFGVGLDYQLSQRVALGSRMIFNFLPEQTLEEDFFYAWEVLGLKLSF